MKLKTVKYSFREYNEQKSELKILRKSEIYRVGGLLWIERLEWPILSSSFFRGRVVAAALEESEYLQTVRPVRRELRVHEVSLWSRRDALHGSHVVWRLQQRSLKEPVRPTETWNRVIQTICHNQRVQRTQTDRRRGAGHIGVGKY